MNMLESNRVGQIGLDPSLNGKGMRTLILDPRVIGPGLVHVMVIGFGSDNYRTHFEPDLLRPTPSHRS